MNCRGLLRGDVAIGALAGAAEFGRYVISEYPAPAPMNRGAP
jgi:hypothetical protein